MTFSQFQNLNFPKKVEIATQADNFRFTKYILRIGAFKDTNNKIFFWNSDLPVRWVKEITDLPESISILTDFIENPSLFNASFFWLASDIAPLKIIRAIKISKGFQSEHCWKNMAFFADHQNDSLRRCYQELLFLRQLEADWQAKEKVFDLVLQAVSIESLLIHTVAYYERIKRDPQTILNDALKNSKEITFCYLLSQLLNAKKRLSPFRYDQYTIEQIEAKIEDMLPPQNPKEGIYTGRYLPREKLGRFKKCVRQAIDFYFQRLVHNQAVDRYLCGYQDFSMIDGLRAELKTNNTFRIQWRNDKKSQWQDILFINQADLQNLEGKDFFRKRISVATAKSIKNAVFQGFTEEVELKDHSMIDLRHLFELLATLSFGLAPPGRTVGVKEGSNELVSIVMANASSDFLKIFTPDYLVALEEGTLLNKLQEYLLWSKAEIEQCLQFLSSDLTSKDEEEPVDILTKPFLKVGGNYFWLSSLMRDRRWDNLMPKRMTGKDVKVLHKKQAANVEVLLAKIFHKAGFKSISSWKHSNPKGDIDVLAYKDDTLFVIEVKNTVQHEEVRRHAWYQAMRFEHKAFLQLKRAVAFIKENYAILQQEEELDIKTKLEDLKIVPLIVSNVFEVDDILIHDEYKKVSLFELQVILENKLYDTLHHRMGSHIPENTGDLFVAHVLATKNRNNPEYKDPPSATPLSKEECNLWSSEERCTPEDLLDAIQKEKVWRGLDAMRGFKAGEKITLEPYDPKVTFLNHPG